MKSMLLTGGSGMVGRNIQEHIYSAQWNIVAPSSEVLDLTNFEMTKAFIGDVKPDVVVHCAGLVGGIQANINNPVSFLDVNLLVGRNTVLASAQTGVENFLNLGSACMYPHNAPNPLSEQSILAGRLEPTNEGYALAKVMTAKLCQYLMNENPNLNYKTLIPCNIFGRFDKFDPARSHLLPAIVVKVHEAVERNLDTVTIWGDGTARREFMYAGDLADAVFEAAKDVSKLPDLVNCGLGYDFSINEYYETVSRVLGWEGNFLHDLERPVGMKRKLCDTTLQQKWGWSPKTSLETGVRLTHEFYMGSINQ